MMLWLQGFFQYCLLFWYECRDRTTGRIRPYFLNVSLAGGKPAFFSSDLRKVATSGRAPIGTIVRKLTDVCRRAFEQVLQIMIMVDVETA
jgi:hypothetical protein